MGGIVVTKKPRMPKFNGRAVAALIKAIVPGGIVERTGRGLDMYGRQFAAYSPRYRGQLRRMGEDQKIDLRLSGGLLNSVKARGADVTDNRVVVTVAPDTGTSPVWKAKAGGKKRYNAAMRKFERMAAAGEYSAHVAGRQASRAYRSQRAYIVDEAGKRVAKQSPPHNIVAHWLHYGTGRMPARPFLGLTPEQTESLFKRIREIMWKWV